MTYQEAEKAVFDRLYKWHEEDSDFTFSVRQKGSKGSRRDYFIGTEKSNYFGFTLWSIPSYYPGSSTDLINYILQCTDGQWYFYLQFMQTNTPVDYQNEIGLKLLKRIHEKSQVLKTKGFTVYAPKEGNRMYNFEIRSVEKGYRDIQTLLEDLIPFIQETRTLVDREVERLKEEEPEWQAGVISPSQFDKLISKLEHRREKYREITEENKGATIDQEEAVLPESEKKEKRRYEPNRILYGPPGTGKTYYTVNHALSIIEGKNLNLYESEEREELQRRFAQYRAMGRIEFVTFHQSFGYEDFVEGIKPETIQEKEGRRLVTYEIKDGVFKRISERARGVKIAGAERNDDFELAFNDFKAALVASESDEIEIPMSKVSYAITAISDRSIYFRKHSGGTGHTLSIRTLREIYQGQRDYEQGLGIYYHPLVDYLKKYHAKKGSKRPSDALPTQNFVLIIDEINRGNIANIFGELITLLEPSKRAGQDEALEIVLPYSGDAFTVPDNLYIIGTMNTADRSVEALDTALRRRFSFTEMPPKFDQIAIEEDFEVDLQKLFITMNDRIEVLLDKDHRIGHAYFMHIMEAEDPEYELKYVFAKKVIPLLQEYFYGNPFSIGSVLGPGFVEIRPQYRHFPAAFFPERRADKEQFRIKDPFTFKDLYPFIQIYHTADENDTGL